MTSPIHVCHVVTGFGGGVYTSVRQIVAHQISEGLDVSIIRDFRAPRPVSRLEDFPDSVTFFDWEVPREISLFTDLHAFIRLFRILRREKPDIVHLHCAKAGFLGRIAARLLRIPAVYSPRGLPFFRADVSSMRKRFYFSLEYILARFGDIVVACSDRELVGVKRLTGRNTLIRNGVNVAEVEKMAAGTSDCDGNSPFTIAAIGLINEARNPRLVSRLANMSPPDWRWIWIGDGDLRYVLEGQSRVEMRGWLSREETLQTLASVDVLLHPSRWEGLPLVVLEAMALERPVIASNIVGNADVVVHEQTGLLADREDDYLKYLSRIAQDPELGPAFGRKGKVRVESEFSTPKLVPLWLDVYRGEINRTSGADKVEI